MTGTINSPIIVTGLVFAQVPPAGPISRSITVSASISGNRGHTGTINSNVIVASDVDGYGEPTGTIDKPITVNSFITCVFPETPLGALEKTIVVTSNTSGHTRVISTLDLEITVNPYINGLYGSGIEGFSGDIAAQIVVTSNTLAVNSNGTINQSILVTPYINAQSGATYDGRQGAIAGSIVVGTDALLLSFGPLEISATVIVGCVASGDDTGTKTGFINDPVIISLEGVGNVPAAGSVNKNIVVTCYASSSDISLKVTKVTPLVVLHQGNEELIGKVMVHAVVNQSGDELSIGKAVVYAVITPGDEPYRGYIFL